MAISLGVLKTVLLSIIHLKLFLGFCLFLFSILIDTFNIPQIYIYFIPLNKIVFHNSHVSSFLYLFSLYRARFLLNFTYILRFPLQAFFKRFVSKDLLLVFHL